MFNYKNLHDVISLINKRYNIFVKNGYKPSNDGLEIYITRDAGKHIKSSKYPHKHATIPLTTAVKLAVNALNNNTYVRMEPIDYWRLPSRAKTSKKKWCKKYVKVYRFLIKIPDTPHRPFEILEHLIGIHKHIRYMKFAIAIKSYKDYMNKNHNHKYKKIAYFCGYHYPTHKFDNRFKRIKLN